MAENLSEDNRTIAEVVQDEYRLSEELAQHIGCFVFIDPNTSQIVASELTLAEAEKAAPKGSMPHSQVFPNNGAANFF